LKWINTIGLNGSNVESVKKDLQKAFDTLSSDINFISSGKNFQKKYCILAARAEAQSVWSSVTFLKIIGGKVLLMLQLSNFFSCLNEELFVDKC